MTVMMMNSLKLLVSHSINDANKKYTLNKNNNYESSDDCDDDDFDMKYKEKFI